jgi:hypothetical protein
MLTLYVARLAGILPEFGISRAGRAGRGDIALGVLTALALAAGLGLFG